MDVNPEFSQKYSQVFLLAMHKNDVADNYVMVLSDEYQDIKYELNKALLSLKYK